MPSFCFPFLHEEEGPLYPLKPSCSASSQQTPPVRGDKAAGVHGWDKVWQAGWDGERLCPLLLFKRRVEQFLIVSSRSAGGGRFF